MANILLVDDQIELLEALSTFLVMMGNHVTAVLSHDEARNTLSVSIPDVILLDVRFNGGDGRELCKEIKEKYSPDIPIILLSASPHLLKNFEECKADDVIEKPFDLNEVLEKINDLLKKYQRTRT